MMVKCTRVYEIMFCTRNKTTLRADRWTRQDHVHKKTVYNLNTRESTTSKFRLLNKLRCGKRFINSIEKLVFRKWPIQSRRINERLVELVYRARPE